MKPKICIIADVPGWAFDDIAQVLKKELSYKYDISIDYFDRRAEADYFYELVQKHIDCDLVHFLNRRMLLLMKSDTFKEKVKKSGRNVDEYINMLKNKFSTSVYDYLDIDEEGIKEHKAIFNDFTKKYYTCTKRLFEIYSSIECYKKPSAMVHDICDSDTFVPINLKRFDKEIINNRNIIIGWVGNSTHSGDKGNDLKGFHSIVKPVMEELKKDGYPVEGYYADKNDRMRTTEEMPSYYSKIDVCLCTSTCEGTPRPLLEAMNCGVPMIATNVGLVPEAFGEKQKEFILGDREDGKNDDQIRKNLKEKIAYLCDHREVFKELSKENLKSIKEFDDGNTIKAFDDFFEDCLNN